MNDNKNILKKIFAKINALNNDYPIYITVSVLSLTAGIIGPLMYLEGQDEKARQQKRHLMNSNEIRVTRTVAACAQLPGLNEIKCRESWEAAKESATLPAYNAESACLERHIECKENSSYVSVPFEDYDVDIDTTTWTPPVTGWVFLESDPSVSEILYAGPEPDIATRADGKNFDLP